VSAAITNFDVRSKGDLEEDVAETVRLCLKRLLEHEDIRYGIAVSIDQYLISTSMLQKHLDAHKNLHFSEHAAAISPSTSTSPTASPRTPRSPPASTSPSATDESSGAEVSPSSSPSSPPSCTQDDRVEKAHSGGWRAVRKKPAAHNRPYSEGTHADDALSWTGDGGRQHRPIDRTGMLTFRGLNVDELAKRFKRRRFNRAKEEEVLDKIIETARETRSVGGAVEMEDILRDLSTCVCVCACVRVCVCACVRARDALVDS
jgi:hypothetical protein